MAARPSIRFVQCPHCQKLFSRQQTGHEECADCRHPAMLARQGYGFEDIRVKLKLPRTQEQEARVGAIVFGKQGQGQGQ